ncbi:MAG: TIM barrel protein [Nitrososphaerota archaeon]
MSLHFLVKTAFKDLNEDHFKILEILVENLEKFEVIPIEFITEHSNFDKSSVEKLLRKLNLYKLVWAPKGKTRGYVLNYNGLDFLALKKLVDKSRERFIDYLVGNKGLSRSEAEKIAKEKIGVAWDVGHLNMMKKKGFSDKDVIDETKKIKDYVKHLHITDNFGFGDSHLAPGMGNVPLKEILKELEKNGEFDKIRKIIEAGGIVQHFKKSPHPYVLSAFGSPIYSAKMGPYWNQVSDFYGSYFGGYGTINPQQHHNLYGSGFTTLPRELGGQIYEGNSRFDGKPMA